MLAEYLTWSQTAAFRRKLDRARAEIMAATRTGRYVVSSSWGKDSCALVHLALTVCGPVDVAHLRSPYELPGGEDVVQWFAERVRVHTVPTSRTLDEYVAWLQSHGLHYERDALLARGKARKADELVEWVLSRGYDTQLLGMRAAESKGRRQCFRVRGLTYPARGLTVCNPLGWWTARDVWAYLVSHDVPWHPLYDRETHGQSRETLRNAGWLSVHGAEDARIAWLRQHYPEQYRQLAERLPQVRRLG